MCAQEVASMKTFELKHVLATLNAFTAGVRETVLGIFQVDIHTLMSAAYWEFGSKAARLYTVLFHEAEDDTCSVLGGLLFLPVEPLGCVSLLLCFREAYGTIDMKRNTTDPVHLAQGNIWDQEVGIACTVAFMHYSYLARLIRVQVISCIINGTYRGSTPAQVTPELLSLANTGPGAVLPPYLMQLPWQFP
eukprot:scaffold52271_cov21-Tisochrysis_lutea.AAC.1